LQVVTLTDIFLWKVVDRNGRKLGHVMDLVSPGEPEAGSPNAERNVVTITYGEAGLLHILGVRKATPKTAAWSDVLEARDGVVVLATDARSQQ
jgi:hypothetical protein